MFAKRLKDLRTSREFDKTQEELAKLLEVQKTTISNYETGTSFPPAAMLIKIADLFGVSIDYLMGRTDNKKMNVKAEEGFSNSNVLFKSEHDVLSFFKMRLVQEGIMKESDDPSPEYLAELAKMFVSSPDTTLKLLKQQR